MVYRQIKGNFEVVVSMTSRAMYQPAKKFLLVLPKIVNVGVAVPSQRHPVADKHLLATVSCSGRCLMGAFARIRVGRSSKVMTRDSSLFLLKKAGRRTIGIGLDKKTVAALRSALAHRRPVTATIYGAILDPSGNIEARTRGKELRVKG